MAQGYVAGLYDYSYPGNPTGAPVSSFNPPPGALVVDTVNFVLYQKQSQDNSSYTNAGQVTVVNQSPVSGANIPFNTQGKNEYLYLTPTGTQASYSTSFGSNADLTFAAVAPGTGGNSITIAYVNGGASQPLTIGVSSSAITVNVATNGGSSITSTASQVLAALQASAAASALITVALAGGSSGAGVVTAFSSQNLVGGSAIVASLTLTFPPDASSTIGETLTVISTVQVTSVTISAVGLTINGDAVTSLSPNVPVTWTKIAAATWQRAGTPAGSVVTNQIVYSASGAISVATQTAVITKTGSLAAMTLAAPTTAQNGTRITATNTTAFAHTITATTLINDGTAGVPHTTATFAAHAGCSITLEAYGGLWNVISSNNVTIS